MIVHCYVFDRVGFGGRAICGFRPRSEAEARGHGSVGVGPDAVGKYLDVPLGRLSVRCVECIEAVRRTLPDGPSSPMVRMWPEPRVE